MLRYGHIAVDCTSPVKVAIINGVLIVSLKSESTISPGITPMIKEFSIASPAIVVVVPAIAATTITSLFPSLALLSTLPSLSPLTAAPSYSPTVMTCSDRHPLPPLLSTLLATLLPTRHSFVLPLLLCILVGDYVGN